MLSWSATETGQSLDIAGIISGDPLISGGRQLAALGLAATGVATDASYAEAVADQLGGQAAIDAAAVAGAFEYYNRIIDATGVPVGKAVRRERSHLIDQLGLHTFPHA
jgi:hypothetical protein